MLTLSNAVQVGFEDVKYFYNNTCWIGKLTGPSNSTIIMVDAATIEPTPTPSSTPTPTPLSGVDISAAAGQWNFAAMFAASLAKSSSCSGSFSYAQLDSTGTSNNILNPCSHSAVNPMMSNMPVDPIGDALKAHLIAAGDSGATNESAWITFTNKTTFVDDGKLYVST
jgi:hypothetical protein